MAPIRLEGVSKVYPGGHIGLQHLDLAVADRELVVLVGPSGCGKSTTLRLIAGLESPTAGRVLIGDRDVTALPPHERDVAMVFQTYALYPHKTVRENLAFPLRMRRLPALEVAARVTRVATVLGIEPLLGHKPRQLSGGQRQRVALGRAMVREPLVFLLDEPLSNLDARLRVRTRAELARLHRGLGATMVYVTHDQEEAMTLGDRVAVLDGGALLQVGPPMELYRQPANVFVAAFIGSPAMNLLTGQLRTDDGDVAFTGAGLRLLLGRTLARSHTGAVTVGIRPPDIALVPPGDGDAMGRVDVVESLGHDAVAHVRLADPRAHEALRVLGPAEGTVEGAEVGLQLRRDRLLFFDPQSGRRIP